jgi:hypothetical protein
MLKLAHFYGWTLDYIRSLSIQEIDMALEYLNTYEKNSQGGETGGSKRH